MPAKKNTTRAKSKNTARARLLDQLAKLDELLGDIHPTAHADRSGDDTAHEAAGGEARVTTDQAPSASADDPMLAEQVRLAVVAFAERAVEWKNSAEASLEFEGYDGQFREQEFDCVECGGEGWFEHGGPDDDGDEVGPCGGCMGSGVEPIEGRLDREAWMDEQVLRHARGERTLP